MFFTFCFSLNIRTSRKNTIFNDEKISKRNKKPFIIDDIDATKIVTSEKGPHRKNSPFIMMTMLLDHHV